MNRKFVQNQSIVKSELRKQFLAKRQTLKKSYVEQSSRIIVEKLFAEIKKLAPTNILVYLSIDNEVETLGLVKQLLEDKINVIVPKYLTSDYQLVKLENLNGLETGPFGISQPKSSDVVDPSLVDVAIIPGVAFDKKGTRLGYGKGVFDKLLSASPALKIGLAYDFQIIDELPKEAHDLVMDMVVTEKRFLDCNKVAP